MKKRNQILYLTVVFLLMISVVVLWKWLQKDHNDLQNVNSSPTGDDTNGKTSKLSSRANIIKINDSITLIDDAGESTYYLVCGTKKALMIDTGNGYDDVMEVARGLTDLPIEVANTHGHVDHVAGDMYCDEVWIHPDDIDLCHTTVESGSCDLLPLTIGQIFDLGDLELEVISIAGHTKGSIGLLDRTDRILFSGDALNPFIWLQLPECLPLSEARKNMGDMMEEYGADFDYHLGGHTTELIPKQAIYDLMDGCDEVLDGKNQDDPDYEWFGGVGKYHLYGDGKGKQVCYDPNNL